MRRPGVGVARRGGFRGIRGGAIVIAAGGDVTGPVISSVVVTQLTNTSVRVTWTTDEASNSRVDYGATAGYGANVTDASSVTSHSVDITGLTTAPQTYHYKVTSVDAATNSTATSDATFATVPILPTANLFGKFEADSGVTKDGSNRVSQWDDLSGLGRHVVQATAADKPLWVANQLNGLPVIRFAAANTELLQSSAFTAETQPNTIFVVCKGASATAQTFVDGLGASGRNRISLTTSNQMKLFAASTLTGVGTTFGGAFVTVCGVFNSASSALYVNNFTTPDVSGNAGGESMDGFTFGVTRGLTEYTNGDIAAVYLFGAALDQTTRNLVRDYINWKWAQSVV